MRIGYIEEVSSPRAVCAILTPFRVVRVTESLQFALEVIFYVQVLIGILGMLHLVALLYPALSQL